ncbi:phage holin family protein [Microlunatus sp. Gsoil 973]|uniref:phage holin family protein n=1 Tax=Microlunatus sp. Gsoil 973 TaxID=2672569 RepID=UPI0012B4E4B5|nr:phage holin family protein [Microlunatus sp. Gsoil 973]QGN34191.1 phage holin family protein [Microlunatus sp. Gsoil 973]
MTDLPTGPGAHGVAGSPADETSGRSIGEVFGDVSRDLTTLLRQEIDLAKAEAKQSATRAGKGAGMYAGAGVAGLLFLVFLSVALWWALGGVIGRGWSGLIVAAIWAIIAAILAMVGRAEMRKINGLPETAETVKKIPPALKGQEPPHTPARRTTMEEPR